MQHCSPKNETAKMQKKKIQDSNLWRNGENFVTLIAILQE